ncbi:MAG: hypothetical protein QGF33_05180 [Alphaproteobacteria bacterium]|jgi:hypothetical protein|nr:hypothetical protein [Alphaproteobacteria bacterium]MEC7593327.1 hypothetical protein [Pseudomonadota bacterium]MEC8053823.1 hypothetical protein [Pseudomonadota bacterium]MEC8281390.1 hypothetical protein [Pseudomonadota bacterium]MEC8388458.1 hypothetical protein [Pseudomonadota bacterium]|tara:strand:+ start:1171 stop:1356 length:186 start_codon:yes stop_codon:yes gene_type:complete
MMYDDSMVALSRTHAGATRFLRIAVALAIIFVPALIGGLLAAGWAVDPADLTRPAPSPLDW